MSLSNDSAKVLVVNCGSSSIKFQLYAMPGRRVLAKGLIERIGEGDAVFHYEFSGKVDRQVAEIADHDAGITWILDRLLGERGALKDESEIAAVGHRVVHGGEEFSQAVRITPEVLASIERYSVLAPLHNPPNLSGIRAVMRKMPHVCQVACFDTAFHATIPKVAYLYALPYGWYEEHGVRRYGFHGASHQFVAGRAAELLKKRPGETNVITAHLGNGCSITAVREGRSVDTSMGLTPLEGLVMGTRSGDFDPAIVFHMVEQGYSLADIKRACNRESGLLGVSGRSNDMRELLVSARDGCRRSRLAIDVFTYRLKKYIGMYFAVLGRVDGLVFTGGIGENAAEIRAAACENLECLGIVIDHQSNQCVVGRKEGRISSKESQVDVLVIPTDEEAAMAADAYQIYRQGRPDR